MFTGIIEELGHVASIDINGQNRRLTVASSKLVKELKQGDSISVSGVCLTAVEISTRRSPATLHRKPGGALLSPG